MALSGAFYYRRMRSADAVTVLYQALMLILIALFHDRIPLAGWWALFHGAVILFLTALPFTPPSGFWNWLRLWNIILIIPINFSELHYLVHPLRPVDMDPLLIKLDYFLFGVHPTVWLERLVHPWLTEYLQVVYSTFYFLPLVLGLYLYFKEQGAKFDYFAFIIAYGFLSSYLLYFAVPAVGPRFTLEHLQTISLSGVFFTPKIRHTLDALENIQRDAFPSGHTAMTLLTMYFARKYFRPYFYILLIIGTSLIFSTVYLRYHYVVDVLGGFLLAALVIATAPFLYTRLTFPSKNKGADYVFKR